VAREPHIVGLGGHGDTPEQTMALMRHIASLTGKARPRVLHVPTAVGDSPEYTVAFYERWGRLGEPSHLRFFPYPPRELRKLALSQDAISVGGGNTANMLAIWRVHDFDRILREAWESGVVLCGLSAGSLCWFAEGVSTFHGPPQRVEGLGLLPWSNTVHYSSEPTRREALFAWLDDGMPPAYAADDGAALHFIGHDLAQVVASRPHARAYRVELRQGHAVTTQLATRYLGDRDAVPLIRSAPLLAPA